MQPSPRHPGHDDPDQDRLRRVLQQAYGHHAPRDEGFPTPVGSHRLARVWLARLHTGQQVALKLGPAPTTEVLLHEADLVRGEAEALAMIAEHTDVPVPAMHHVDDSHALVEADWLAMEALTGRPLDELAPHDQAAAMPHVEAAMTALERIEGDGFGRFLQPQLDSWGDAFTGGVEDLLADATRLGVDLGCSPDEIHRLLLTHGEVLDEVTTAHFVEWDRHPHNLLIGPDHRPTALLDHTATLWGDELMAARWMAATQPELTPWRGALAPRLRPLTADELARRRLYDLFVLLVQVLRRRGDETARQQLRIAMTALDEAPTC